MNEQSTNSRYYCVTGESLAEVKEKIKQLRKRIPEHPQFSEMSRISTSPENFAKMQLAEGVENMTTKEIIAHGYFAKYENIPIYVSGAVKPNMVMAEKFES